MKVTCKHCNHEIELTQDILDNYFNWKCPNCYEYIKIKGTFVPIWKCDKE